jgi:hypothetical protein
VNSQSCKGFKIDQLHAVINQFFIGQATSKGALLTHTSIGPARIAWRIGRLVALATVLRVLNASTALVRRVFT